MSAELIVTSSNKSTGEQNHQLGDFNIVGRGKDTAVRIQDNSVSREHSSIRRDTSGYWINDLASANGTYLNNLAVTKAELLRDGDIITFGTIKAIFSMKQSTGSSFKNQDTNQTRVLRRTEVELTTTPFILLVGDIKGFTEIASKVPPERLAALMRGWYDDCQATLAPLGATIDKFIGDAVFAYWRDTGAKSREAAVQAARALSGSGNHSQTAALTLKNYKINFECRIGLHIGEVAHGAMTRGNNTALGDAVNLTFRLESLTRNLNAEVLASAAFLDGWPLGLGEFSSRGYHRVKGHPDEIEVFELND
ncbi:MAG: FHA domain-containing protein [Akkermansiaceae bacterium]